MRPLDSFRTHVTLFSQAALYSLLLLLANCSSHANLLKISDWCPFICCVYAPVALTCTVVSAGRLYFTHMSCAVKASDECCGAILSSPFRLVCINSLCKPKVDPWQCGLFFFCTCPSNVFTVERAHVRNCTSLVASVMFSVCACSFSSGSTWTRLDASGWVCVRRRSPPCFSASYIFPVALRRSLLPLLFFLFSFRCDISLPVTCFAAAPLVQPVCGLRMHVKFHYWCSWLTVGSAPFCFLLTSREIVSRVSNVNFRRCRILVCAWCEHIMCISKTSRLRFNAHICFSSWSICNRFGDTLMLPLH